MRILLGTFTALAVAFGGVGAAFAADDDDRRRGHHERHSGRDDDNRRGEHWRNDNGRGDNWRNDNRRDDHRSHDNRRHDDRRDWNRGGYDNRNWSNRHPAPAYRPQVRGRDYWGPHGSHWSRWNNGWGDPRHYARQWGFDEYHHSRGWRRGTNWYVSPSDWSGWGGWSWSIVVSGGNHGWNNNYASNNCRTYSADDWVNGRRAVITYTGCADQWGRVYEQPGTRRVERWLW